MARKPEIRGRGVDAGEQTGVSVNTAGRCDGHIGPLVYGAHKLRLSGPVVLGVLHDAKRVDADMPNPQRPSKVNGVPKRLRQLFHGDSALVVLDAGLRGHEGVFTAPAMTERCILPQLALVNDGKARLLRRRCETHVNKPRGKCRRFPDRLARQAYGAGFMFQIASVHPLADARQRFRGSFWRDAPRGDPSGGVCSCEKNLLLSLLGLP